MLKGFASLTKELLAVRDLRGYFVELNAHQWNKVLGWSIAELQAQPWLEFIHPDDRATTIDTEEQYIAEGSAEPLELTHRFLHRDQTYRWLSWRFVFNQDKGLILGLAEDITSRRWQGNSSYQHQVNAAVVLRDQAIAAASVGIVIADTQLPDMPLIYVNQAFETITGYAPAEVLGYNCRFLQGKEREQPELEVLRTAVKQGQGCTVILKNYRKDGTLFWNELSISPIYNPEGKLINYVGIQADVTARILALADVRLRDQAIAASSVGIVIADFRLPDRPLIYVNKAFERMTGYGSEEVLGKNCRFLQGADREQPALDELRKAIALGQGCKVILRNYRKNGTMFWNELEVSPIRDDGGQVTHFIGVQSDVTRRIETDEALRLEKLKSEQLLLNILPRSIVKQLQGDEHSRIAKQYHQATILFADLVGFTHLSSQLEPLELIDLLNHIFSAFDRLVEKYGIEKIKTIGDAYMAVAGVPIIRSDHAIVMAHLALEMVDFMNQSPLTQHHHLQVRVGMNSGSVVAGVIGLKKFSYDLWGDAVNVASRMESQGMANQIQVTAATHQLLQNHFTLTKRGEIEVKGKGLMTTYFLGNAKDVDELRGQPVNV